MARQLMWAYTLTEPYMFHEIELPAPAESELAAGEVLLRVRVGGICGSDLPFFTGMLPPYGTRSASGRVVPPPGAPLHEVVGEVVASRDPSLEPGVLVVGWATRHNAIAEYIIARGSDLHAFGPELSPSAAIMLQPLACVIYAVDRLANVAGSTAAVIGQGPIGVLFSHVLKRRGRPTSSASTGSTALTWPRRSRLTSQCGRRAATGPRWRWPKRTSRTLSSKPSGIRCRP